jgi:hypothetical protein
MCYRGYRRKHTPLQRIQKDMVDDLRHLEGIRGPIDVASESRFIGTRIMERKTSIEIKLSTR